MGLKKLITTHYHTSRKTYKLELIGDMNEDGTIDESDVIKTPLKQNGDFRSPECVEILKEADIVITNPPFSLFREYVAQLVEYKKDFLIIGNQNAITYKEIFPLIARNKIWLGCNSGDMAFRVPSCYKPKSTRYWETTEKDEKGDSFLQKWRSMGNITWYTNIDHNKRHEELILYKKYTPEEYPKYDNYNAINVDKVVEIPCDYDGVMGVPITFLDKYNPEQFEIIGTVGVAGKYNLADTQTTRESELQDIQTSYSEEVVWKCIIGLINGKKTYRRILIRNKKL